MKKPKKQATLECFYKTKREYAMYGYGFERGMIRAWAHARMLLENCI